MAVVGALRPHLRLAGDERRRDFGLRPGLAIVEGGRGPGHLRDADEQAVRPLEEAERLAAHPLLVIAGHFPAGPGGSVVPLHRALAEQPATVLLLEEDRVGEELAAGLDETGVT